MNTVAYARYSTENQTENSIAYQVKAITEYCVKNSLTLVDVYTDEALSGTNTNRPGFTRMLQDARKGKFKAVVVYDITRGSRDVVDWFSFRKEMHEIGVKVLSTSENLGDVSDPNAFLMELITTGIGQHQVLQSRKKSIDGKRTRAEKGLFCGGIAPLGYDIVDGRYIVNALEAEAVKLIFDLYASGKSYSHICEQVARMGIVGKRGQKIGNNTLYFILRNIRYTGKYVWFEEEVRFMHKRVGKKHDDPIEMPDIIPRLVSDDIWKAVQERMDGNKKNTLNKSRAGREYLLSGLLKCGICGGSFSGHTTMIKKKSGLEYEYRGYSCTNKTRLHTCTSKRIGADKIETLVVSLVTDELLNGEIIEKTADAILEAIQSHVGQNSTDIKKEIAKLESAILNLSKSLDYDNNDVRQILLNRMAEHSARIKILKEQLGSADVMPELLRDELIEELRADSKRLTENADVMRELLQKYIVRIDVAPDLITIHAVADLATLKPLYALPDLPKQKNVDTPDNEYVNTTGSPGKTRTYNPPVNSRMLCH